jgi:two-component system, LuxR family, sensor kinase FixL
VLAAAEHADGMVEISVADNGPGLPEAIKAKLFQPFVSTKKAGMGVGLSICHTIIAAHNGRLWAEPDPGGGTVFRMTLPCASVDKALDV